MPFYQTENFMKKFVAKILSCSLAVVLALFVLNGCALITTNAERDMAQVIATVEVDSALKEDVYKRELVSAYNSQGYYYVQYMGMTVEETYNDMLEDIVRNRILKQQAKLAFTGKTDINEVGYFAQAAAVSDADKSSYDHILSGNNYEGNKFTSVTKTDGIDKFLTEYEYYEVYYDVLTSVRNLVDGYSDEEDEHEHGAYETFQGTARTTLTTPSEVEYNEYEMRNDDEGKIVNQNSSFYKSFEQINKESELGLTLSDYTTKYDLALAVYKTYYNKFTLADDRSEVNKLVRDLKTLGFITSEEAAKKTPTTKEEILSLTYFKDALDIQLENKLIEKFELALQNEQEKKLASDRELYNAYLNAFNNQKLAYGNYTTYETALENASDSSLVLYNPEVEGKYGYVLNLLIGFSEEQSAILTAVSESSKLTKTQKAQAREELLGQLVAKDLRNTWVESYYGTYENGKFTFGDDYVKTDALKTFGGNIYGAKEYEYHGTYDEHETRYSFSSVKATEIPFEDFYSNVVSSVMGFTGKTGKIEDYGDDDYDKFLDLIFAYSTDDGSLSDGYGYVYSPKTSATTYVTEFANAAKEVVDGGVGSYTVVATEYGYHIILCTKVIEPSTVALTYDEFIASVTVKDSIPYLFKEYQKDRLVVDNVDKITEAFFKSQLASSVDYIEDNYKDLLKG